MRRLLPHAILGIAVVLLVLRIFQVGVAAALVHLVLLVVVLPLVFVGLVRLQARDVVPADGWRTLGTGPALWVAAVMSSALAVVTGYAAATMNPARAGYSTQLMAAGGLCVAFGTGAVLCFFALLERVRWNDDGVERRTWAFRIRRCRWADAADLAPEWTGYWVLRGHDGARLRISPLSGGFAAFLDEAGRRMGRRFDLDDGNDLRSGPGSR